MRVCLVQVNLAVDLMSAPTWIWSRYPDAASHDADGRTYSRLSWFHGLSNAAARQFLSQVSMHLAKHYVGCIVALQPVYNNAYQVHVKPASPVAKSDCRCRLQMMQMIGYDHYDHKDLIMFCANHTRCV